MKFLLILIVTFSLCLSSVLSLEESLCAGIGFFNLNRNGLRGYRTTGWDRLYAVNKDWTGYFWSVQSISTDSAGKVSPTMELSYVRDLNGNDLNGWLHISVSRPSGIPFHYAAIWVVTERNEVYGTFIFDTKRVVQRCTSGGSLYSYPYAYIPCSAGPVNVESVPGMFVYANLEIKKSPSSNQNSIIEASVSKTQRGQDSLSVLWRSPPQTYCNRPKRFRILYAASPVDDWTKYAKDWDRASRPGTMWLAGYYGPIVQVSDWIYPNFYGLPSKIDTAATIECGGQVTKAKWVSGTQGESLAKYWYVNDVWKTFGSDDGEFGEEGARKRSTCKGHEPTHNAILGFKGRCSESRGSAGDKYYTAKEKQGMKCADETESLGKANFKESYNRYLGKLKKSLRLDCQCRITTSQSVSRSWEILMRPPPMPWHPGVSKSVKLRTIDYYTLAVYKTELDICAWEKVNVTLQEIVDKGGICVQTPVGKLVYGVRQFHGVTSLCATIIITPLSIFIARYTKGDMEIIEGKIPIKAWYLTHVLLVFPPIWMHASGMATMSRQTDVIGHSLTDAAKLHRFLGIVTFVLIPFHVVTGYLRPLNWKCRKVFIFIHWFGGYAHHILELFICCMAFKIPSSPSTGSGIFSPHFGNIVYSSKTSLLVISWLVFSIFFNVLLTIRRIRHDRKIGMRRRSVFPIIIPVFTQESRQDLVDAEHSQELCFERGALLIYLLVSCIVFVISVVALYQALHENLYYGFGPMSCTHDSMGKFISSNDSQEYGSCVH